MVKGCNYFMVAIYYSFLPGTYYSWLHFPIVNSSFSLLYHGCENLLPETWSFSTPGLLWELWTERAPSQRSRLCGVLYAWGARWFSCFQQMGFSGKTLGFDAKTVGWSGISNSKTAKTLGFPNTFVWLSHNTCRLDPWGSGGRSPLETWIATEKIAIAFLEGVRSTSFVVSSTSSKGFAWMKPSFFWGLQTTSAIFIYTDSSLLLVNAQFLWVNSWGPKKWDSKWPVKWAKSEVVDFEPKPQIDRQLWGYPLVN